MLLWQAYWQAFYTRFTGHYAYWAVIFGASNMGLHCYLSIRNIKKTNVFLMFLLLK